MEELLALAEVLRRARLGRDKPPAAGRATILTLRTGLSWSWMTALACRWLG